MILNIYKVAILLLLPMLSVSAQNPDPHGTEESAITGIRDSETNRTANTENHRNLDSKANQKEKIDRTNHWTIEVAEAFGKGYARAWCSQNPEYVAQFYAENGTLTINNGTPSVGRKAITQAAKSFMDAFPNDMVVAFDKLEKRNGGIAFHWTLTGTNTGPGGTGKSVNISGFELWQLDDKGLIKLSQGSFDAEEYNRQLTYGVQD